MKRTMAGISVLLLLTTLSGCGATAKTMAARSASERSDVFTEVAGDEAAPPGFADMFITTNIKTHLEGFYKGESASVEHGKDTYPFLVNIDGQAVLWRAEGIKHELPEYVNGKTSHDPEAGTGIKYILNKKVRLRVGSHKVFFGLPADNYYREIVLVVNEGEAPAVVEYRPRYKERTNPTRMPTFLKGVSHYAVFVNGVQLAP